MPVDEQDLREGLRALTAAPPAAPELPHRSIVRAGRIRLRRRAATAAAAVLAVVAPLAVVRTAGEPAPRPADLASSLRYWPEHRPAALRAASLEAVAAWHEDTGVAYDINDIRWLYVGEVAGTGRLAVVLAHCPRACTHVAVLSKPAEAEAPPSVGTVGVQFGWSGRYGVISPTASAGPVSALFDSTAEGPQGRTNVALVVAPPETRRVVVGAVASTPRRLAASGNVYTGDVGIPSTVLAVSTYDGGGVLLTSGLLGVPGDPLPATPNMPVVRAPVTPPGYRSVLPADRQRGGTFQLQVPPEGGPFRVLVRCSGPGDVTVAIGDVPDRALRCDGRTGTYDAAPGASVRLVSDRLAPAAVRVVEREP